MGNSDLSTECATGEITEHARPLGEIRDKFARFELLNQVLPGLTQILSQRERRKQNEWADQQHQFIRIVPSYSVPMVELTADTERAIGWVEDMQIRHFVGTESRFLLIVQLLNDIVQQGTEDPLVRLEQLERQRNELDRQITLIKETGQVDSRLTPTQLRERFLEASALSRQLLRDFRLVEDRFRDIARELQKAQLQPGARKGELVKYVLDADAALKDSDQGRSFYSFWAFLISPSRSEEFSNSWSHSQIYLACSVKIHSCRASRAISSTLAKR